MRTFGLFLEKKPHQHKADGFAHNPTSGTPEYDELLWRFKCKCGAEAAPSNVTSHDGWVVLRAPEGWAT